MNLMDMLSADPPSSLYSQHVNNIPEYYKDVAVLNDANIPSEITENENGVFYLPALLTRFQNSLVDILLHLFSSELLTEARSKRMRTSIDSLLESSDLTKAGLTSYEKISLLYEQLMTVNSNPSLLVDHFIPKNLLLSEINERQINLSGKLQLFNRIVDCLIENTEYPKVTNMLVVARDMKELELIEGLIIGKRLYYQNYSSAKLYDDRRGIPNFHEDTKLDSRVCLNLITSSQLYNKHLSTNSTTKKYDLIFSFDFKLDVSSPTIEILRSNPISCPVYIPIQILSIEHISQQFPQPKPSLSIAKDTSHPLYKWKIKIINAIVVNKFNMMDIDHASFYVDNFGPNMKEFTRWLHHPKEHKDLLRKYTEKLALNFTDDKLIKKLNICLTDSVNREFDSLGDFDYKSYRAVLAESLHAKLEQLQDSVSKIYTDVLPAKRRFEASRQIHYDDDEDLISSSYFKLRRLSEDATIAERKLCRIENELVTVEEKETDLTTKYESLVEHMNHDHLDVDIEKQSKSLEQLREELSTLKEELERLDVDNESTRQKYQNSSATAVQLSARVQKVKNAEQIINSKLNGPGLTSLPALLRKDALLNYESQLNRLQSQNLFMTSFFNEKIDKLYSERQQLLEGSNVGSNSRPTNRVSRSSTPL
ncbi:HDA2 [[Candida] subhashii]|uniref:HDA2 n=1 Tax=[Candida] subhashii TaxID=561895 RepID=A0A8J5QFB6_9ASCO|nr:HDA2 [[Candida] subhashii]KAG7664724.1 HDA2 [[Candida] subhashii]